MTTEATPMQLRLTRIDAQIIEHRLSAGTIGEIVGETWGEQYADAAEAAEAELLRRVGPLMKRGGVLEVRSRLEAWCIADCVEGSTWDGGGGFDHVECDRLARQVGALRRRLNACREFVDLLGREVMPPLAAEVEGYSPFALPKP